MRMSKGDQMRHDMLQLEMRRIAAKNNERLDSINAAFRIAEENGIAGYAIETRDGWIAADRKPLLRAGKVIECLVSGTMHHG